MKLIAITGSIGCGKTTIAKIIRKHGYAVFDVDAWVRRMYFQKSFIAKIADCFPEVMENGIVNKRKLRNLVFNDPAELKKLEGLTHPFLKSYLKSVIGKNSRSNSCFFLDVALLYEMGWDKYCKLVVVADVDYEIQKKRVMLRDNVEAEHFDKINDVQMSNEVKKDKADIVINTDKPHNLLELEVVTLLNYIERL
uniref:Dephospho-CoA kinase n=1 Tax=uncultured Alphaproteobacteria bacterium TaxID=91750 RepID=A0A6M4NPB4_9PROT|nr:dephospho-CoA kinase [uncultured Alphaproteobacteria bacterium]